MSNAGGIDPEPIAHEPDPVPESQRRPAPHCHNCGSPAPGIYCPECGQETRVALPTVRELMRDAAGRLVALDSRLWRTLYCLLLRPGMLTTEYLLGRRKRYVRPARLFFVTSLLLFAVVRFLHAPITIDPGPRNGPATPAPSGKASAAPGSAEAGAAGRRATTTIALDSGDEDTLDAMAQKLPAELRKRVDRFKHLSLDDKIEQVNAGVLRYAPYAMVVLLPVYAFLLYLSYLPGRRRHPHRPRRYAEHLVFAAHLHAFVFLMIMAMVLVRQGYLQVAMGIWIAVNLARARTRVYGGTWFGGLLRSMAVGVVYLALLVAVMAALVLMAVALG